MKKVKLILTSSLLLIASLTGCDTSSMKDSPFISEIFVNENFLESVIEVTNKREISVDLMLNIYNENKLLVSRNLKEDFKGKTNTSIVYENARFDKKLDSNVNIIKFDDNYIFGTNYIEIIDSKGNILDSIGTKGFKVNYINNGSLIKNEQNLFAQKTFDYKVWYKVRSDNTKYLGNLDTPIKYDDFLKGPKIMEVYWNAKFIENSIPLGGFHETTVSSYGDGDTTNFTYIGVDGLDEVERTRYYLVNTPEIDHTSQGSKIEEEAWGVAAMNYTNEKLKNAKHILIQSALSGSLRETYGRLLGFVWYTNEDNPTMNDYSLLNYELVLEGYAKFMTGTPLNDLVSNDVLYYHYFDIANEIAESKGIKIHGEKDPNFNY